MSDSPVRSSSLEADPHRPNRPHGALHFLRTQGIDWPNFTEAGAEQFEVVILIDGMERTIPWRLLESAATAVSLLDEGQQEALEEMEPTEAAALFSSALPTKARSVVDDRLGPFYESEALAGKWGISEAAVHKRVVAGHLLRLLSRGRAYYPTFQFDLAGGMLPGLAEVQRALAPALSSPVSVAFWLRSSHGDLDDRTPVEVLRGGDVNQVVQAAAQLNERLSA